MEGAIEEKVVEDWWEQVGDKSSLGWLVWGGMDRRVKEDFTVEEYVKVLDRFRLRTGTAGLLVDNKRLCKDSRCVMCDSKCVYILQSMQLVQPSKFFNVTIFGKK